MNQPAPKPAQRPRSPRFPFIPLKKALQHTRTLHDQFGVKPVGTPRALKALGFDTASGKANRILAALKAYGLVARESEESARICVSPDGAALATGTPSSNLPVLRQAALRPLPFRRFWHNRPGIAEEKLAHLLEQRNFTEAGARRAARVYTANVNFAQLEDPAFRKEGEVPPLPRGKGQGAQVVKASKPANQSVPQRLRVPLGDDFATIPVGLNKEEFQLLMQTLRLWKPQIIASALE